MNMAEIIFILCLYIVGSIVLVTACAFSVVVIFIAYVLAGWLLALWDSFDRC